MIKAKIFGWRCKPLDVVSRIEEGLSNNDVIFTDKNPDLIYKNEDFFDEAIEFKKACTNNPFVIFNILDLQIRNPKYNIDRLKDQLAHADIITCISHSVKNQIKEYLNIEAEVIYNPIKDISRKQLKKTIPFLYVGRANDENKRFYLIKEALSSFSGQEGLVVCGSENPNFGQYVGVIDDETLNDIYNASRFVLLPSKFEGIGLSMIEGMIAGSIPITCNDNPTAIEFSPKEFISDPNPKAILDKMMEIHKNYKYFQKIALEYGEKYLQIMNKNQIAKNIINIYNKYNAN
ncbi:MAG: glycosyltransferase [Gammaproteobacteria bacterium]|nr:glycosyltransferase [Gammaproteobacteria bacterium]